MSRTRHRLTATVEQAIVAYIRAGGFPHVAAEAAGIPTEVFDRWMRQGEAPDARPRQRAFALAVRQAEAQARLGAEVAARNDRPLDWLRNGPGRHGERSTGWTGTVRPPSGSRDESPDLRHPAVQELLTMLLRLLEPYPEARLVVADALARTAPPEG